MLSPEDRTRLLHIREAASKAIEYLAGLDRDAMAADEKLTLALTRWIEIIGEAAKNVSAETRERAPGIPWSAVWGMRDRPAPYFDVDLQLVWEAIHDEMPPLLRQVEDILRTDEPA